MVEDLGDGLILRQATREDTEAVVAFNARVHSVQGGPFEQREPSRRIASLTRDLMSGDHPACDAPDFTLVEDTSTGTIVSSACLIPQRFSYDGIEFDAGLPELVGTHPDYRRRGLIREQFGLLHRWGDERGHLMQAIAGIPYYYRRFGYEMAVTINVGRRVYLEDIPGKHRGEGGPARSYSLRPATASDARVVSDLYRQGTERYLLTTSRDERACRYEVDGRDPESEVALRVSVVENEAGEPAGYVCVLGRLHEGTLRVESYELANGISWLEVNPFVLEKLVELGRELAQRDETLASLTFALGDHHPLYEAIPEPPLYSLDHHGNYSYYVRVPDLPAFLRHVTPVLESRLAASVAAGHTGKLEISFYAGGLRLELERGRLSRVEDWTPTAEKNGDAAFPDLTFLQLLFGYRSIDELDRSFADCSAGEGDARVLLEALFPRRPSDLKPVC